MREKTRLPIPPADLKLLDEIRNVRRLTVKALAADIGLGYSQFYFPYRKAHKGHCCSRLSLDKINAYIRKYLLYKDNKGGSNVS